MANINTQHNTDKEVLERLMSAVTSGDALGYDEETGIINLEQDDLVTGNPIHIDQGDFA